MRRLCLTFLLYSGLAACADTSPAVILETDLGVIEIEVLLDKAPKTGANFLYYVDEGLYDGEGFYRAVRPDNDPLKMDMSLIQGGRLDLESVTMLLPHEPTSETGLSNTANMVSVARDAPGTGSAAFFFINAGDNTFLDHGGTRNPDGQGYAVFGQVTNGMDVVRAIQARETDGATAIPGLAGQYLTQPVTITKAYRQ